MQEIWLFFKAFEITLGILCTVLHVIGFTYHIEPLPHNMFYCTTFMGFTLVSLLSALSIYLGNNSTPLVEAITSGCAAISHFMASIISMYNTEHDLHLMYLTDLEEPQHPYFKYCTRQSISALVTAAYYMIHTTFALDAICLESAAPILSGVNDNIPDDGSPKQATRMYMLGAWIHDKLETRYTWFRRLAHR